MTYFIHLLYFVLHSPLYYTCPFSVFISYVCLYCVPWHTICDMVVLYEINIYHGRRCRHRHDVMLNMFLQILYDLL